MSFSFRKMTSKELYKRFASLCQKWPKDETKAGRDYGEFYRKQLAEYFPQRELSQVTKVEEVDSYLNSLERLASNQYFNENPLKRSSATGLEGWACREAVSNEGMRAVQEDNEAQLIRRLKKALSIKFVRQRDKP